MSSFPRKREPSAFARTGPESGKSLGSRFRGNDDQGRSSKSRNRVPNPSHKSPAPPPHPHPPQTHTHPPPPTPTPTHPTHPQHTQHTTNHIYATSRATLARTCQTVTPLTNVARAQWRRQK